MRITDRVLRAALEPICLDMGLLPTPTVLPRSCTMPMIASVYCLVGEDDKILYCGQSRNVRLRMAQHANSPRKARLNYAKIAVWTPQLVSPHQRLVLESIITALAIPPGNSVVALRRTKWGVWTEITSLRWSEYKGK